MAKTKQVFIARARSLFHQKASFGRKMQSPVNILIAITAAQTAIADLCHFICQHVTNIPR